jgi:hypothetical protein
MTNAMTHNMNEWNIKVEREGRKYVATARRGKESVLGTYGKTEAEAVQMVKRRLRDGGYAE